MQILESDQFHVLSSAGSHTWARLQDKPGMAAVFLRQYSDWQPGGPVFDPLCRVFFARNGTTIPLARRSYVWKGASAEAVFASEDGSLRIEETANYVGADVLLTEFVLHNNSGHDVEVTLAGQASSRAAITSSLTPEGLLQITLNAPSGHMWGKALHLDESFVFAFRGLEAAPAAQSLGYRGQFTLRAGEHRVFTAGFAHALHAEDLRTALADPVGARAAMARQLDDWMAELPLPEDLDEARRRRCAISWFWIWYSVEEARGLWPGDILTPSKSSYGRGIWLWDSGFHIPALLLGGPKALRWAADQVEVLCANLVDGHLPREVWLDVVGLDLQAPGILTWAAVEIHRRTGDDAFLRRVYPALAANNNWFLAHRLDADTGLCWWDRADSGWDTSPRWDEGPSAAVDLNAWLSLDQALLSRMAAQLGEPGAEDWREKAARTRDRINAQLWHEEDGCYYDRLLDSRRLSGVKSPAMYWPLFAGIAEPAQAERMRWYLNDPAVFATPWPLPCVAANDPAFEPGNYWRGPVWINLNWIVLLGLRRYGLHEDAARLEARTVELIERSPVPYEYYNPLTGEGLGAANFMWTAALHLVLTLGEVPPPECGLI